jgi:hypothetical protein
MTSTAIVAEETAVVEMQVSGIQVFDGPEWRKAILHYLDGMRTKDESVTYRPKIHFSLPGPDDSYMYVDLRLEPATRLYYACGIPINDGRYPDVSPRETIVTSDRQSDVEQGLTRFVQSDAIRIIMIRLGAKSTVCLWKSKDDRNELNISASGIRDIVTETLEKLAAQA